MADISFGGADEMMAKLYALGAKMAGVAERKALKSGGEILREEISNKAPRDTGDLAESITVSRIKSKDGIRYVEVGPNPKTAWRAKFIEFGTSKMAAKPFMTPAVEAKRREVLEAISDVLREELRKA